MLAQPASATSGGPVFNYMAIGPYDGSYRDLAKKVKTLDAEAMLLAAAALRNALPDNAVLVPLPSHTGEPTFTKVLCSVIASKSRCPLCDCLRGTPRESLCDLKNREYLSGAAKGTFMPSPDSLGFYLCGPLPQGKRPVLIDNVVASGTTAKAALRLFGEDAVLLAIAVDEGYPKVEGIRNCRPLKKPKNPFRKPE